jgi:hypothetical protein
VNIIVIAEHRQEYTLAETAWADKEKEVPCPFHLLDIHGFIHHILAFFHYLTEVG